MQRYRVVIMLVLFGVLPVVVAFFVALSFLEEPEVEPPPVAQAPKVEKEPPPPPPPETRKVFAAARALPVGTLLGRDDLEKIEIELTDLEAGHFKVQVKVKGADGATEGVTADQLRGYAVREALAEGAQITRAAVVGPRQRGFLATVLRPGTRAVTIRVGPATSQAGLIDPGDLVDVILSAELGIHGGERVVLSRTIAEEVRVVAINQIVEQRDGERTPTSITTATLEATPAQADRLVLGEHEGRLSLAVRSLVEATVAKRAEASRAVELREMLLSSPEFSASKERLRRVEELSDIAAQQQLIESRAQLRAAIEADAARRNRVRVFRGTAPAEVVVFENQ